ncbi:hypothetical protein V6N13_017257 [Hibiscus sabdariffa]|uniref:Uncharacterized protein n=1 Tax=Hibiscus sabdariffa TaxID=183260 RepID=A0ABR2D1F6_9ROSI
MGIKENDAHLGEAFGETHNDGENGSSFFPELEPAVCRKKAKSKKRYGSLMELQDKALTELERRKRDRRFRRNQLNKKSLENVKAWKETWNTNEQNH